MISELDYRNDMFCVHCIVHTVTPEEQERQEGGKKKE